jgi:FKBP-type peptidyl-prolyl cis-trans isomerase FkpA
MRKISYLLLATAVAFSACTESYKKGDDGMQYKIIASGKGETLKMGEFLELHFTSILSGAGKKDSVLNSSRDQGAAQIMPFDSTQLPPAYFKIFKQMRNGDSLSTKTLVDSMFKNQPQGMPPFMKKGMFLVTNIKIINVYKNQADADKARQAGMAAAEVVAKAKGAELAKTDDKTLTDFFAKNNIKATKTAKGTYVELIQAGTGAMLDSNVFAKINYTGKTLDGKMFDSNTDPSKGHVEPLIVNLTNDQSLGNGVIPGMSDGLIGMQKGAKGKLYIPSGLAYGPRGAGGDIAPNANLIFEVEILDMMTKAQVKADNDAKQKINEAKQKQYMDSVKKATPPAAQGQQPANGQPQQGQPQQQPAQK